MNILNVMTYFRKNKSALKAKNRLHIIIAQSACPIPSLSLANPGTLLRFRLGLESFLLRMAAQPCSLFIKSFTEVLVFAIFLFYKKMLSY